MKSVIETHIMIVSSLLPLLPLLRRCCSGTCSWKPAGNSSWVRGLWRNLFIWQRAWWLHHLELEMPHLGDSCRKANKTLLLDYMWLLLSVILPTGQPGGKHAAPDSESTKISSLVPVPDGQSKTADLRLACKDVAEKWTALKWKWSPRKDADTTLTWSISLTPGSIRYF